MRHGRRRIARPQLRQRLGVHPGVLAHLKAREVEAERLGLPDQVLQLTVRLPDRAGLRERRLDQAQVGEEVRRPGVGQVEVPCPGGGEPLGRVQQVGAVGLARRAGGDLGQQLWLLGRGGGERPAQPGGRRGGVLVDGQRPADPAAGRLKAAQRVLGLDRRGLPGHRRRDVRVAVPVAAHPGAEPDERRHRRRRRTARGAEQHVVERPVHGRHQPEQRLVERGHHRADLVGGGHAGDPQLGGPPEQVDLLAQLPALLRLLRRSRPLVVDRVQQLVDPAQRRDDRAAAGLGGMRGEDRVHPEPGEQPAQVLGPALGGELVYRVRERLARRAVA